LEPPHAPTIDKGKRGKQMKRKLKGWVLNRRKKRKRRRQNIAIRTRKRGKPAMTYGGKT
jgi:hypothetical protein